MRFGSCSWRTNLFLRQCLANENYVSLNPFSLFGFLLFKIVILLFCCSIFFFFFLIRPRLTKFLISGICVCFRAVANPCYGFSHNRVNAGLWKFSDVFFFLQRYDMLHSTEMVGSRRVFAAYSSLLPQLAALLVLELRQCLPDARLCSWCAPVRFEASRRHQTSSSACSIGQRDPVKSTFCDTC